jgi:hypothetical protein
MQNFAGFAVSRDAQKVVLISGSGLVKMKLLLKDPV